MHHALSLVTTRPFLVAGALLLIPGCITGVKVGQDGQGGSQPTTSSGTGPSAVAGSTTGTGGSTGAGGTPTGATCTSPAALLCPWGKIGGPCGGNLPFAKACDASLGYVCMGGSADTEGTCNLPDQPLIGPGDACGAGVPSTPMCPWNYQCNAPIAPDGVGICVPNPCVLGDGTPPVSAASLTVDGDGATQHFDFACAIPAWPEQITGEASAWATNPSSAAEQLQLAGCQSPDGDSLQGSLTVSVPLEAVGTVTTGSVLYRRPNDGGNFSDINQAVTFTVTELSADLVRGTYAFTLGNDGNPADQVNLSGAFEVCRLPSHAAP